MAIKAECSKCDNPLDRKGQRYCKSCHAEYMRENRPVYSELTPEQKLKSNCRSASKVYLKRGKLTKQPCEVCGTKKAEMHHEDYTKPKQVNWLCRKHHLELHTE